MAVVVEKQPVKLIADVVVVRDIRRRSLQGVVHPALDRKPRPRQKLDPARAAAARHIAADDGEHVVDRAALNVDAAIHEQIAEGHFGIAQQRGLDALIRDFDQRRVACAVADDEALAARLLNLNRPDTDQLRCEFTKNVLISPPRQPRASKTLRVKRLSH